MEYRTCLNCGWVHTRVNKKFAQATTQIFNDFYNGLSELQKHHYYGMRPTNLELYEKCNYCSNNYKNFRDSVPEEINMDCVLGPIIVDEDDEQRR